MLPKGTEHISCAMNANVGLSINCYGPGRGGYLLHDLFSDTLQNLDM